jgi:hypothetical protein
VGAVLGELSWYGLAVMGVFLLLLLESPTSTSCARAGWNGTGPGNGGVMGIESKLPNGVLLTSTEKLLGIAGPGRCSPPRSAWPAAPSR